MVSRYTRLRVRRKIRTRKKQVVGFSEHANKELDRHIFRRWHNLRSSWRFVAGWVGLLLLLSVSVVFQTRALGGFYLAPSPIEGGVYTEGMTGSFTNANPIYATNEVDAAVSKLLFSPLLSYDKNNQLVGDLAESWSVDERATQYTVKLKPNLVWHDGKELTADDVVFTYSTVQNPDAKSPLLASWTGVKVEKVDNLTIKFTLPGSYSPFPHSLTTGILPAHSLSNLAPEELRSAPFNTKAPIGSGPFRWKGVVVANDNKEDRSDTIRMVRFERYHKSLAKLDGITIRTYANDTLLRDALASKQIITAAGLGLRDNEIDNQFETVRFNLMTADMLFMNNSSPILSDKQVRIALTKATNVPLLNEVIGYPAVPVREPLLKGQIGFDPSYYQHSYNRQEAITLLEASGWKLPPNEQVRKKDGIPLKLTVAYENSPEFARIIDTLQKMWTDLGVDITIDMSQGKEDSRRFLDSHSYDVLLYGINIGADPDVYAYWHSSQIDKKSPIHLNLSEYKSKIADNALEGGRTRVDPALRAAKYRPFLEAWRNDAPAIGLHQPQYLYITNQTVYGLEPKTLNTASDRFGDVHEWMINTARTKKQ